MKITATITPSTAARLGLAEAGQQTIELTTATWTREEREVLATLLDADGRMRSAMPSRYGRGVVAESPTAELLAPGPEGVLAYVRAAILRESREGNERALASSRDEAARKASAARYAEEQERLCSEIAALPPLERAERVGGYWQPSADTFRRLRPAAAAEMDEAVARQKAAREQAKLDYIADWVREHGTDSERARHAAGMLCRDTIVARIAAEALAAAPEEAPETGCRDRDCPCKSTDITCLGEAAFAEYQRLGAAGLSVGDFASVTYCLDDSARDEDSDDDPQPEVHTHATVTAKAGPFTFERRIVLA